MFAMGLGKDARTTLLTAAALAPSLHNSQPWRLAGTEDTVFISSDPDCWLPREDPTQSSLFISLGAAVFNVRVAAAQLGRLAHVSLLPPSPDPYLVARLDLAVGLGVDPELLALFPYLARRRTNRMPFAERAIPQAAIDDLQRTAHTESAVLRVVRDASTVDRLLRLAREGTDSEALQPERLREREHWVGGERAEDGVPLAALGGVPAGLRPVVRELAVQPDDRLRPVLRYESRPVLAVLTVPRDDPRAWLSAGQALERVLLTAARWGLSASFLNQALYYDDLRRLVAATAGVRGYPQMIMRLGYAELPDPTPRRPVPEPER